MKVPFHKVRFGDEEQLSVLRQMDDNWFSPRGPCLPLFGQKWADYVGRRFGWPVSSGTAAIHLALLGLGIGPGDAVLVPSYTCSPTVYPVSYVGAQPIFVDCELNTYGMNAAHLKNALKVANGTVKAVIIAHLYGSACDDAVISVCQNAGVALIEDCCEGDGATYIGDDNSLIGSQGVVSCYSFRGDKVMTALGTGGIFLTDDEELFNKMKLFSDLGLKNDSTMGRYRDLEVLGYNYEISNPAAAFGIAQINRLPELIADRRVAAGYWFEMIHEHGLSEVSLMYNYPGHVWYQFPIRFTGLPCDGEATMLDRLGTKLIEKGVPFIPPFWPMHRQPVYFNWRGLRVFPYTDLASQQVLCFPCYPDLQPEQVSWMVTEIRQSYQEVLNG